MHRRVGQISEHGDDSIFKNMTRETFDPRAASIDAWCQSPNSSHPLLEILREVSELKKLNANLYKTAGFDDLLGDTYTAIFAEILPTLGGPLAPAPPRENTATPAQSNTPTKPTPVPTPERANKMALDNVMNIDGALDKRSVTPVPSTGAGGAGAGEAPTKSRVATKIVSRYYNLETLYDKIPRLSK